MWSVSDAGLSPTAASWLLARRALACTRDIGGNAQGRSEGADVEQFVSRRILQHVQYTLHGALSPARLNKTFPLLFVFVA
jgi:hypothetical protein